MCELVSFWREKRGNHRRLSFGNFRKNFAFDSAEK